MRESEFLFLVSTAFTPPSEDVNSDIDDEVFQTLVSSTNLDNLMRKKSFHQ
jgi:hypothetical protein